MRNLFNIITAITGLLMVLFILVQSRGQGLGTTFGGGDAGFHRSRRGAEAVLFNATIVISIIFVLAIIPSLLSKQ